MRPSIPQILGLSLALPLVILAAVGGLYYRTTQRLIETERQLGRIVRTIEQLDELIFALENAESEYRGFLISGDDDLLRRHQAAVARIPGILNDVAELASDNPVRQAQIEALRPLIQARLEHMARKADLRGTLGVEAAEKALPTSEGTKRMDEVRDAIRVVSEEDERVLELRLAESEAIVRQATVVSVGGSLAGFVMVLVLGFAIIRAVVSQIDAGRAAKERLEEQRAFLRQVIDINPSFIFAKDREGRFTLANRALAEAYGSTVEQLLGKTDADFNPNAEEVAAFRRDDLEVMDTRRDKLIPEEAITDATGAKRWLYTVKRPLIGPDGTAHQLLGVATDITERKRTEEQLRQSQKMEAIGQLAGGVAHDFNNLLGVITGYSDLLLKDIGPQHPGRKRVELIQKAAERAAALTRQLLAFSRKQILQPKVVDLNAVVRNIEHMLRRLIGEDIEVVTDLGAGLGRVSADPGQIEQVILNLAVNARDAMPGGGKLIIETKNVELDEGYARRHAGGRPGPHVMLAVSDTGHGMDAETMRRIFEPFFTTKELGKGTGLGLATVYGIVKQSGGYIGVYSEPRRGSTFKVYLPRIEGAQAPEGLAGVAVGPAPRGAERILLVEDDQALRVLIHEILEEAGYTVIDGPTPAEALAVGESDKGPIQLMLTDVVMPGMSGRELAERLKGVHPHLKVLYMSGYTDSAIVHHGVLDAGTFFIGKPFTSEALLRKVREVLDAPEGLRA